MGSAPVWHDAKRLFKLWLPLSGAQALAYTANFVTTAQVGHLGAVQLSAFGLSNSMYHVTGVSLTMGVAMAMETFCGQLYGAGEFRSLGALLQRALLISAATGVPALLLWFTAAERLLLALGQQPEIAALASVLVRIQAPMLVLYTAGVCLQLFLTTQRVVWPITAITALTAALTPFSNHLFIHTLGLGVQGAAVSLVAITSVSMALTAACAALHIKRQPPGRRPWLPWSSGACLTGWGAYAAVALPSVLMLCVNWWAFDAVIPLAGLLPGAAQRQAAMTALLTVEMWAYLVINGAGVAACVLVANALGAGQPRAARRMAAVATGLTVLLTTALVSAMVGWRWQLGRLFSADREVVATVADSMPWVAATLVLGSTSVVMQGVLRGLGRQAAGAAINLFALWLVGLPGAAWLALRCGLGVRGLWMGLALAEAARSIPLLLLVALLDWGGAAGAAACRVASESVLSGGGDAAALPLLAGDLAGDADGDWGSTMAEARLQQPPSPAAATEVARQLAK